MPDFKSKVNATNRNQSIKTTNTIQTFITYVHVYDVEKVRFILIDKQNEEEFQVGNDEMDIESIERRTFLFLEKRKNENARRARAYRPGRGRNEGKSKQSPMKKLNIFLNAT